MASTGMRAALYDKYGGPDVLYEGTTSVPKPKSGEVLVRVHAASVNGLDVIVRSGALRLLTGRKFPRGTGLDFAGEIAEVSEGTKGLSAGDLVWGCLPDGKLGSIAEFVCVLPEQLSSMPKNLDFVAAAALPVVGATALIALRDIARLRAGERLLVRGANGGVGMVAVQVGRVMGAKVAALASASNLEFVRELGADRVFDYAVTTPAEIGNFDVIVDTVGSNTSDYRRLLRPKGRMIAICPDPSHRVLSFLYILVSAAFGTRRVRFFSAKPKTRVLGDLASYVEGGAIRPVVDIVYELSGVADAHKAMEKGGRRGKQIVRLS